MINLGITFLVAGATAYILGLAGQFHKGFPKPNGHKDIDVVTWKAIGLTLIFAGIEVLVFSVSPGLMLIFPGAIMIIIGIFLRPPSNLAKTGSEKYSLKREFGWILLFFGGSLVTNAFLTAF